MSAIRYKEYLNHAFKVVHNGFQHFPALLCELMLPLVFGWCYNTHPIIYGLFNEQKNGTLKCFLMTSRKRDQVWTILGDCLLCKIQVPVQMSIGRYNEKGQCKNSYMLKGYQPSVCPLSDGEHRKMNVRKIIDSYCKKLNGFWISAAHKWNLSCA